MVGSMYVLGSMVIRRWHVEGVIRLSAYYYNKLCILSCLLILPQASMVNSFSDVQLKEYAKTAMTVAKSPWNLLKAQQYLQELCDANRKGGMQKPQSRISSSTTGCSQWCGEQDSQCCIRRTCGLCGLSWLCPLGRPNVHVGQSGP